MSHRWVLVSSPPGVGQARGAPIALATKERKRRNLGNLPAPWPWPDDSLGGRRDPTIPGERSEEARHGVKGAPRWTNMLKDAVFTPQGQSACPGIDRIPRGGLRGCGPFG